MRRICLIALFLALISACSPSEAQLRTAIIETEQTRPTSTPIPTPTKIPLSDIDLEPLLVEEGDLPPGVSESQVRSSPPAMFDGIPQPTLQIYQVFEKEEHQSGGVAVLLYEDLSLAEKAFAFLLNGMGETKDAGLGDQSTFMSIRLFGTDEIMTDVLWMRCNSVVHVRIGSDPKAAITYGERLNRRLEPLVCP